MDGRETRNNFLKFYFDPDLLTEEEAGEILKEEDLDPEKLKNDALDFLEGKKAALKIEKGKELKALADKIKNQADSGKESELQFRIAARNLEGLSENDKKILNENLDLLKGMEDG